jgi:DNA-binding transcriptional LysR family regulator
MNWDDRIGARLRPKDLHTLQTIGELGSMAKASSALGLSQPSISKAVADLERMLGTTLLDRSARGVELTDTGRMLVERGRVIFDELRQCVRDIRHLSDPTQGHIRIGTTEPLTIFIAQVIGRIALVRPALCFEAKVSDTTDLLRALRERELDIAITGGISLADAEDLEAEPLFAEPLAVLAATHHPLAGKAGLQLSDLTGQPWVLPPPESFLGGTISDIFTRRGLPPPKPLITTASVYMQLNLVVGGMMLTILPARLVDDQANLPKLHALNVDLANSSTPIAAMTVRGRRIVGPLPLFQQVCREVAKLGKSVFHLPGNDAIGHQPSRLVIAP